MAVAQACTAVYVYFLPFVCLCATLRVVYYLFFAGFYQRTGIMYTVASKSSVPRCF